MRLLRNLPHDVGYSVGTCVCLAAMCVGLDGAEFVVKTTVSHGSEGETPAHYTTLFAGDRAFDYFSQSPGRATVFDFQEACTWQLDQERRERSRMDFSALQLVCEQASRRAEALSPLLQFAARPEFTNRDWDPQSHILRLEHRQLDYEAQLDVGMPADIVARYREFADWSARLNTLLPGLPAAARLELNREIAMREGVPRTIRSRRQVHDDRFETVTSEHEFLTRWSPGEQSRLQELQAWMTEFQERPGQYLELAGRP